MLDTLIVGSGFAGLGAAVQLDEAGRRDFLVLEKGDALGGTWRDNVYPGCACDVESHLYSFSFFPNPDWTRTFARQPEIRAYLEATADRYRLRDRIRFGVHVVGAEWDGRAWDVRTSDGTTLRARFVLFGTGALHEPAVPEIEGLDRFAGTAFHSSQWDHTVDLAGKRVAVIGTGASAIQFVPAIAPAVAHLTLFQRTAPWVLPKPDRPVPASRRRMFRRFPPLQRLQRLSLYWRHEALVAGFLHPRIMKVVQRGAELYLRRVLDPPLRRQVTPDFTMGCKRILMSNDYYPALARPNVDVVTDGIVEVRPNSIVTRDASGAETEHEVDTIILGTGFQVSDPPVAHRVFNSEGRSLADHWGTDVQAFRGTTIAGFPNAFILAGPNTGLGHTSQVFMIEAQIRYTMQALKYLCAQGLDRLEVRPQAQHSYNEMVARSMEGTVWVTGGCDSWYLNEEGRNTTLWPTFTWNFALRTRWFDPHNYDLRIDSARRRTARERAAA
jgi:cation diffusion facilitator CzcD-associated flavoprotein CzcO